MGVFMKKTVMSLLLILCMTRTFANEEKGRDGGNGGGVWVCQNQNALSTVRKIELVDFYEAEKEFKLVLKKHTDLDAESILDLYKYRIYEIDKNLANRLEPYFLKLQKNLNLVDTDLEVIDDSLFRVRPNQSWCEGGTISYQQMANYTNYGSILINDNLFNHGQFSEVEKAGLYLHEVVYSYLREKSLDKDSQRARKIVGVVASTLTTEEARVELELNSLSINKYNMEFVKIAKGEFIMGSPSYESGRLKDENQVIVTISKDFSIMKTEVTQLQYFKVMGKNPAKFKKSYDCPSTFTIINGQGLCPNNPVERVSRDDIQKFIAKLNSTEGSSIYRLPTEAEWEYAGRAGSSNTYFFGADDINKYAWYKGNSMLNGKYQPHPVAEKLANANGLYDMYGNVRELVQDGYDEILPGGTDPIGMNSSDCVVRGSSYDDSAKYLRSAYRSRVCDRNIRYDAVGFRLVRNL